MLRTTEVIIQIKDSSHMLYVQVYLSRGLIFQLDQIGLLVSISS